MPYRESPGFPDDPALIVHKVYDEVIDGNKTVLHPISSSVSGSSPDHLTRKDYVDGLHAESLQHAHDLDATAVHKTGNETVAGTKTFTTTPLINESGAAGEGEQPIASRAYVVAREQNLITNGSGTLRNNYNFSAFTAVPCEPCPRAFQSVTTQGSASTTELIHVNPSESYRFSLLVRNGEADGTYYVANSRFYAGISCYDVDGLAISAPMYTKYPGSTDTTLAQPLAPGDTLAYLTDGTGWGTASASVRQMTWWPYSTGEGCVVTPYTYSRYTSANSGSYASAGMYGGVYAGVVLTLTSPWPAAFGTLPAGTPVRNSQGAGAYQYCTAVNRTNTNTWTRYDGKLTGLNTDGAPNDNNRFPYGTTFVKPTLLYNYTTAGARWHFANLQFSSHTTVGENKSYVPTWGSSGTQPVLGDGYIYGNYYIVGQTMWVEVEVLLGSTSTPGTGEYYFTMPSGYTYANASPMPVGAVSILDASATEYWSGWAYYGAPTPLGIHMRTPSATPMKGDQPVTATHPITFTSGDRIRVSVRARLLSVFA